MTGVEAVAAVVFFAWIALAYAMGYQDGKKEGRREAARNQKSNRTWVEEALRP